MLSENQLGKRVIVTAQAAGCAGKYLNVAANSIGVVEDHLVRRQSTLRNRSVVFYNITVNGVVSAIRIYVKPNQTVKAACAGVKLTVTGAIAFSRSSDAQTVIS
jgi:hypothetical protein